MQEGISPLLCVVLSLSLGVLFSWWSLAQSDESVWSDLAALLLLPHSDEYFFLCSKCTGGKGVPGSVSAQISNWDSGLRLGKLLGFRAPPLYLYAGSA